VPWQRVLTVREVCMLAAAAAATRSDLQATKGCQDAAVSAVIEHTCLSTAVAGHPHRQGYRAFKAEHCMAHAAGCSVGCLWVLQAVLQGVMFPYKQQQGCRSTGVS
jgi:hypothetical protein